MNRYIVYHHLPSYTKVNKRPPYTYIFLALSSVGNEEHQ